MKVIPLRNIIINGQHCAALTQVEVEERTGLALLAQRLATLPLPAGQARTRAVETTTHTPPIAETAARARASTAPAAPPSSKRKRPTPPL